MDIAINSTDEIKYRIEDYLLFCLANEESLQFLKRKEEQLSDLLDLFVMRKAKRIRPILLLIIHNGYAKKQNETIIHAAVALELMHTFALIHDDIIDQSKMRGKTPTLYHAINQIANKNFNGEGMAMLVGDLIYNIALNEFQKVKAPLKVKVPGMELLVDTALNTGHGQLQELVQSGRNLAGITPKQILRIYDKKTAYYTFCLPMQLGVLLAGGNKKDQKAFKEIGLNLGRAFQIIDDINDFDQTQLSASNYLCALLWQEAEKEERKRLRQMCSDFHLLGKKQNIEWLKDLYSKHDIIRKATTNFYHLFEEGKCGIEKMNLGEENKDELTDFIDSVMKIKK